MAIAPGTRLGSYEIVALIGAGGMGEVYRASDARLEREVAIKVLPGGAAASADRLQRFAQEARATAALNHPHIVAVHDIGSENGTHYVVSELLEGETLRSLLERGPLSPRKAIEYAAQVARGLSAAHQRHIVHRDLKPDNIFITRDGRAKILDFGLARILHASEPRDQTVTAGATAGTTPGTVLGTMGYMSPEQVRGLGADHRSDIFSFGAVLYEMVSGKRAFRGATPADTMTAILRADPPELETATRGIPPILDRLVRRCLEKSPEERYQSAQDLAFNLEALSTTSPGEPGALSSTDFAGAATAPRARSSGWGRVGAALLFGLAAGGAAGVWRAASPGTADDVTYRQLTFRRGDIASARFAPDGHSIMYAAAWEGRPPSLFTGRVDGIAEQSLPIEGQVEDVSSTGEVLLLMRLRPIPGQMTVGTLARMPLGGGAPRAVMDGVGSASWGSDGQQLAIVRARFTPERRWSLEYPAGTVLYDTPNWIEAPRVSSDGARVAFFEHPPAGGDNRGHVSVVTRSKEKSDVTGEYSALTGLAWHPNGELWFGGADSGLLTQLRAVRPGAAVRRVAALPAAVVLHDVRADGGVLLETVTLKSRILVRMPGELDDRDLGWLDYPLLRDISPDGKFILFDEQGVGGGASYGVFMRPTDGGPAVRLTDGYAVSFAPDMTRILATHPGRPGFRIVPVGPGEPREFPPFARDFIPVGPARFWPDGKHVVLGGRMGGGEVRTYLVDVETGHGHPITPEKVIGSIASPDARSLAVTADGELRIFNLDTKNVTPIKGLAKGDQAVRWSPDGGTLFVSRVLSPLHRDLARLDLTTGRREVIATIRPADAAGVSTMSIPVISADGRVFAYRHNQRLSDLFVATGLK
ncbi:MAG TPA: protein kinase [Vicinamibacterales bacterium]|nr:protein kinase [Vicinamibacterales bacterium]